MKRKSTKYPQSYVEAYYVPQSYFTDDNPIDSAIAKAKEQIRDSSEHFINDDGDDCFAIYEDDAIKIITDILNGLKGE